MSSTLRINYLILDKPDPNMFESITIDSNQTVKDLRESIRLRHQLAAGHITHLEKVTFSLDDEAITERLRNFTFSQTAKIWRVTNKLAAVFVPADLAPDCLHLIIQPAFINVNCVFPTVFPEAFRVKIAYSENVKALLQAILANVGLKFLPMQYIILKASINIDAHLPSHISTAEGQGLALFQKLFEVFDKVPNQECVHVIVKPRFSGILQDKRKHDENDDPPLEVKRLRMETSEAPSALAPASRFKKIAGPEHGIALNRPFESSTIPLVLLHEAFASFKDRCEQAPSEQALLCLSELAPAACEWYDQEVNRRTAIQPILAKHMGIQFHEQKIACTEYVTGGNLAVTVMPAAIRGCKDEHGETLNRVILHYTQFLHKAFEDPRRFYNFNTRFPSILMVDMSSYFGFYGAVWDGKRVRVEPLTPLFDLSIHWKETNARCAIAASLDALRVAVDSIEAHYRSVEAKVKMNPTPPKAYNPDLQEARGYPFLTSYRDNEQEMNFMYKEQLHAEKLVFRAAIVNQPEPDTFLVKFTQQYSEDAHNCLASRGLAPRLRQCVRISAHWIAVIMDESKYQVLYGLSLWEADKEKIRRKVMTAVRILHQEGFVHGDIRASNILVDVESLTSDDVKIHLIDLDWAGPIGEAKYPADLNRITVRRPDGVIGGGPITEQHDIDMVSLFLFA